MDGKTAFDIIAFIASIASLILAVVAIWLSVFFFRLSDEASKATTGAAKGIAASVDRLEKLFDKLYSDTFSMMKDTVTDMRNHIWNKPQPNQDKSEVNDAIKKEIESRVKQALEKEGIGNKEKQEKVTKELGGALESILKEASAKSRSQSSISVLEAIRANQPITMGKLSTLLNMKEQEVAIQHLFPMREEGQITWDSSPNSISSTSLIRLSPDQRKGTPKGPNQSA